MFNRLKNVGQKKEQQAQRWLAKQGIDILASNYLCKGGEIDIIGLEPNVAATQPTLVFFEVKYRKNSDFGEPLEMVHVRKQQRIIHCAQFYLLQHAAYEDYPMRFDVVAFTGAGEPVHLQHAFEA